jgi:transmembrane sensor
MNDREDEEVRTLIARQAADWFLAQREGNLGTRERKAFDEWLLASPVHVAEYLGITAIALALPTAADDPACPVDTVLERARTAEDAGVRPLRTGSARSPVARDRPPRWRRWQLAAAAALAVVIGGVFWWSSARVVPQFYATARGEQRSWPLADRSVLRLNTDTAVTVRYGRTERLVELGRGQAFFEVAHEPARRFRVAAGTTDIVAVGTQFDVHMDGTLTVVTVVAGRVMVSSDDAADRQVPVSAGEQLRVVDGVLPVHATPVDAGRSVAWLRQQISFDQKPLVSVVAEFNRYGRVPIEIETPSLKELQISGVFTIGDTDTFVAFLRTVDDVKVETTPARIRVSRNSATPGNQGHTQ